MELVTVCQQWVHWIRAVNERLRAFRFGLFLALGFGSLLAADGSGGSTAALAERAASISPGSVIEVHLDQIIDQTTDLGRGRFWRRITGQRNQLLFSRPYGVAWEGDSLLVTDPGAGQVIRLSKRGKITRTAEALFQSPIGIAICEEGTVVSDSATGKLALLDRELRLEKWIATGLERPTGVACLGTRIFVAETLRHRVLTFDSSGEYTEGQFRALSEDEAISTAESIRSTRTLGERGDVDGTFNFPTTLGIGQSSLWVGDTLNFRLQRFDLLSGNFTGSFGRLGDSSGEMPRVKAVCIDPSGRLWVTDAHLDQVAVYSSDGTFLVSFGKSGTGPGELSFPAGLAVNHDGRVVLADSLNRRLQIFQISESKAEEGGL